ncbi:MAG: hypothetical protein V3T39_00870 [Gammaproteobacteria bacterium]
MQGRAAALQAVSGGEKPVKQQSTAMLGPMSRGIGVIDQVLAAAGPQKQREILFTAPPLGIMVKLAGLIRSIFTGLSNTTVNRAK